MSLLIHQILKTRRVPKRILLIKPSSLGDIVHALPVVAALRRHFPQARISWLINRGFAPLLIGHPCVDELIPFDRGHYGQLYHRLDAANDFLSFMQELREARYDWVIDLQGLFRTGFLAYITGADVRVGFGKAREFAPLFYRQTAHLPPRPMHAVDRNLAVLSRLGLPLKPAEFPLPVDPTEREAADALLAEHGIAAQDHFTALIPGARWIAKQWLPERYGELADRLLEAGLGPIVLLGSPDERPVAESVRASCRHELINLTGETTLSGLVAMLARAKLVVCNDSGPMHLAAALNRPMAAIFGPTDPRLVGPYSSAAAVIRTPERPTTNHKLPDRRAMDSLTVEAVFTAVGQLAAPSSRNFTAHR